MRIGNAVAAIFAVRETPHFGRAEDVRPFLVFFWWAGRRGEDLPHLTAAAGSTMYIDIPIAALVLLRQCPADAAKRASLKAAEARDAGDLEEADAWSGIAQAVKYFQDRDRQKSAVHHEQDGACTGPCPPRRPGPC